MKNANFLHFAANFKKMFEYIQTAQKDFVLSDTQKNLKWLNMRIKHFSSTTKKENEHKELPT